MSHHRKCPGQVSQPQPTGPVKRGWKMLTGSGGVGAGRRRRWQVRASGPGGVRLRRCGRQEVWGAMLWQQSDDGGDYHADGGDDHADGGGDHADGGGGAQVQAASGAETAKTGTIVHQQSRI